ncbi:MAG: alpha-E domain-containing protein [Pseudomonadota bacterium]
MLSRTAENLFWAARYLERAEGTARLIEMGQRMSMLPGSGRGEWRSVAAAAGASDIFEDEGRISERTIIENLLLSPDNSCSIRYCLNRARDNARAVRAAVTQEMWEALNDGWRRLEMVDEAAAMRELPVLLEWVKTRANVFRGAAETSMLRNDGYFFLRLGGHIERADLTLRLLDVKYFVLLPETEVIGGGRDHHQWTSVLHATSALRAYHHQYKGDFKPWLIADFLILNKQFPRSLAYGYSEMGRYLDNLALAYGERHICHMTAASMIARLADADMGEIFQTGLHDFIAFAIAHNNKLSGEISRSYHF